MPVRGASQGGGGVGEPSRTPDEQWIRAHTPRSNDARQVASQYYAHGSNKLANSSEYWYPKTNVFGTPETVCFGRLACNAAYAYSLDHPDDAAGAKEIAANYCVENLKKCQADARVWARTMELGDEGVMAAGAGTGRLIGAGARKFGGCTQCFLAGTDVLMADGTTKDIEDVGLGDKVQARDPETGEAGAREVTHLIVTEDDKYFNELSIATEGGVEQLTATYEHPFWSPSENDWIEAGDLEPGVTLLTDEDDTVIVTGNRAYTRHARTYNLTVDDLHTFYVLAGNTPVLVHNSRCQFASMSGPQGVTLWLPQGRKALATANNLKGWFYDIKPAEAAAAGYHKSTRYVRVMNPVTSGPHSYPNGYVSYLNEGGQIINPITGKTVVKSDPF